MSLWIRKYAAADVSALCALWLRNFDDTENFVRDFHEALPHLGSAVVAGLEGKIIGAAYTLNGQALSCPGEADVPLGFLYGVSVDREYRRHGVGAAVVKAAYELSKAMGAEIVGILPARAALYDWYGELLGMEYTLSRSVSQVKAAALQPCTPISSGEYLAKREALLGTMPHVSLSAASMEFAKKLMCEYGGELYSVSGGIAAAYMEGGLAIIRELILPDGMDLPSAASSLSFAMGAEEGRLYMPSTSGDRYILSDRPLPPDCIWNLSFD